MPLSPLHQRQKHKNIMLLVVLLSLMALLFGVTLVRVGSQKAPAVTENSAR